MAPPVWVIDFAFFKFSRPQIANKKTLTNITQGKDIAMKKFPDITQGKKENK